MCREVQPGNTNRVRKSSSKVQFSVIIVFSPDCSQVMFEPPVLEMTEQGVRVVEESTRAEVHHQVCII